MFDESSMSKSTKTIELIEKLLEYDIIIIDKFPSWVSNGVNNERVKNARK